MIQRSCVTYSRNEPLGRRDPASFTDAHRKKPAALLVGYAGGSFRGNTVNHELPRGSTVDDVLEDALFKSGGVKLSNYRSRALARLKWSRSSRTDKGVSSLATVVSLRLELDPAVWDADQGGDYEAKALCAKINARLPETVRVFGVYSTPKSFQARRACVRRTYDYLLPARCLGISSPGISESPGMGIPGDVPWPGAPRAAAQSPAETLALFRDALSKFEGSHYFHNYTRRAAYSRGKDTDGNGKGRGSRGRNLSPDRASDADSDVLDSETEEAQTEEALERGEEDEKISEPVARHVGSRRDGVYWLLERDENDLVGIKHNRRIVSFVAGDVETLTLDTQSRVSSEPFVRVTVRCLELGAGTGFLGMSLARDFAVSRMLLTEMVVGGALTWLDRNVARNRDAGVPLESLSTAALDWAWADEDETTEGPFASVWDVVIGSDLVYNEIGVQMLPRVFARLLAGGTAVAYYAHTLNRYEFLDRDFFKALAAEGLRCQQVWPDEVDDEADEGGVAEEERRH
mgnify:CR=1 FL=1